MAKSTRGKNTPKQGSVRNSRATVSGPAARDDSGAGDVLTEKAAGTQDLASALPFNPIKSAEYNPAAASAPPEGPSVTPPAFGEGEQLLATCGIEADATDTGLIVATTDTTDTADAFVAAMATHRHFARQTDPPRV